MAICGGKCQFMVELGGSQRMGVWGEVGGNIGQTRKASLMSNSKDAE